MRWQILIATVEPRTKNLCELLDVLSPQLKAGDVEVLCCRDGFGMGIGSKRNLLVERAQAQYVNFVDDDDMVVDDYVDTIYPLLDGIDYVSFQIEANGAGYDHFVITHGLTLVPQWFPWGRNVDIGHLCPMRREIHAMGRYTNEYGDDAAWGNMVRSSRRVRTEHHIDRVMYEYRVSAGELWHRGRSQVYLTPNPEYPNVTFTRAP